MAYILGIKEPVSSFPCDILVDDSSARLHWTVGTDPEDPHILDFHWGNWKSPGPVIFDRPMKIDTTWDMKDPFRASKSGILSPDYEGVAWSPLLGTIFLCGPTIYAPSPWPRSPLLGSELTDWFAEYGQRWGVRTRRLLDEHLFGPLFYTTPANVSLVPL